MKKLMKRSMKRVIAALVAMVAVMTVACPGFCCGDDYGYGWHDRYEDHSYYAYGDMVKIVGGNCNVRTGPGKMYEDIGTLYNGTVCEFAGSVSTDYRGVDWYEIYFHGDVAWVSSRYSRLL